MVQSSCDFLIAKALNAVDEGDGPASGSPVRRARGSGVHVIIRAAGRIPSVGY